MNKVRFIFHKLAGRYPCIFSTTKAYTFGLDLQYALSEIMDYLNPEWKEQEKDKIVKAYLEVEINEERLDSKAIMKCIWGLQPTLGEEGYNS